MEFYKTRALFFFFLKGETMKNKLNILGLIAIGLGLLSNVVSDMNQEKLIKEEIENQLAEREESK